VTTLENSLAVLPKATHRVASVIQQFQGETGVHTKTCSQMISAALLIIAPKWNQPNVHQLTKGKPKYNLSRQWNVTGNAKA
jgi:hypothetical protein